MLIIKTARGRITTYHGEDAGRSRPHVGIDIGHGNSAAADLRMVAPAAGRVVAASWEGTYGNRVIIEHDDGSRSLIAHMVALTVGVGARVQQGQTIGVMGRTGGPWGSTAGWFVHGHQEYHIGGIAVDPLAYMAGGSAQSGTPQEEDDMFDAEAETRMKAEFAKLAGYVRRESRARLYQNTTTRELMVAKIDTGYCYLVKGGESEVASLKSNGYLLIASEEIAQPVDQTRWDNIIQKCADARRAIALAGQENRA